MLKHGFDMYNVYISSPGDLGAERDACRKAISAVNEQTAMPAKILMCFIGLLTDDQIVGYRSAVADNIRQSTYFIQIFEDDWGPKNLFLKMFRLALECRDAGEYPMRDVIVCLKNAKQERDQEILAFREELEQAAGDKLVRFDKSNDLMPKIQEICGSWVEQIAQSNGAGLHST